MTCPYILYYCFPALFLNLGSPGSVVKQSQTLFSDLDEETVFENLTKGYNGTGSQVRAECFCLLVFLTVHSVTHTVPSQFCFQVLFMETK